jgi:hypothetical protein
MWVMKIWNLIDHVWSCDRAMHLCGHFNKLCGEFNNPQYILSISLSLNSVLSRLGTYDIKELCSVATWMHDKI